MHRRQALAALAGALCAPSLAARADDMVATVGARGLALRGQHRDIVLALAPGVAFDKPPIHVRAGATIRSLRLVIDKGATPATLIRVDGPARIDRLEALTLVEQSGRHDLNDAAVVARGDGLVFGTVLIDGFDSAMAIIGASGLALDAFTCRRYRRGLYLRRVENGAISGVSAAERGRGGEAEPGSNGLLINGARGMRFGAVSIEDAGEHAVRIGGRDARHASANLHFDEVSAAGPGQCGFKINPSGGPDSYARDIRIGALRVTDCSTGNRPGRNEDALRVERALGVRVDVLEAHRAKRRTACYAGIYVDATTGLDVAEARISHAVHSFLHLNAAKGPSRDLRIGRLEGVDCACAPEQPSRGVADPITGAGVVLTARPAAPLTDIRIDGGEARQVRGDLVRVRAGDAANIGPGVAVALNYADIDGAAIDSDVESPDLRVALNRTG